MTLIRLSPLIRGALVYFGIFLPYFQSASLKAAPVSNDKTEITVTANVPEVKDGADG
jgi:hypothetical protein